MTDLPTAADETPDYRRRCRESFARQPILATLKATLTVPEPGLAIVEIPHDPGLLQQTGFFHAGVAATIADSAGGFAALSLLPPGSEVLAAEFKINYLAPGRGERLRATGRCIKAGRTLSICTVAVHALDGGREVHTAQMQQTVMRIAEPA